MADWAGKTLGKVHINELVARGGMAEVYIGTHESFGRVAVKVMRGLLEQDSDQLARFQREAEVIASLNHPNHRTGRYAFSNGLRVYDVRALVDPDLGLGDPDWLTELGVTHVAMESTGVYTPPTILLRTC